MPGHTATVIGDAPVAAVLAGLDMAAERRGPALLDRRHDLELLEAEVPGMGGPIGGTSAAENIGDLERGLHGSAGRRLVRHEGGQPLERAGDGMDRSRRYLGVKRGRLQLAVAKQDLDHADIDNRANARPLAAPVAASARTFEAALNFRRLRRPLRTCP